MEYMTEIRIIDRLRLQVVQPSYHSIHYQFITSITSGPRAILRKMRFSIRS